MLLRLKDLWDLVADIVVAVDDLGDLLVRSWLERMARGLPSTWYQSSRLQSMQVSAWSI